jgi:hypothetical protein
MTKAGRGLKAAQARRRELARQRADSKETEEVSSRMHILPLLCVPLLPPFRCVSGTAAAGRTSRSQPNSRGKRERERERDRERERERDGQGEHAEGRRRKGARKRG